MLGLGAYFAGEFLLSIYTSEAEVVKFGLERLMIICTTYAICGVMDVMVGSIRGIGYSIIPTIITLLGVCVIRVIWIYTVFKIYPYTYTLYLSYPITWLITAIMHIISYLVIRKKRFNLKPQKAA